MNRGQSWRSQIDQARRRFAGVWPPVEGATSASAGDWLKADAGQPEAGRWDRVETGPAGSHPLGPAAPTAERSFPAADQGGERPDPWAGPGRPSERLLASLDPGRRAVRVLAAILFAVALFAGVLAWCSRPGPQPLLTTSRVTAAAARPATVAVSASAQDAASGTIVVAVTGRVAHPGLVTLPSGARVADAIAAAGGVLPGTDLSFVNLARRLSDGELIVIGVTPPPGALPPDGGPDAAPGPVDLNTASEAELEALPGVGPTLAGRILAYRTQHGGFRSVDELRQVSGIGDAKFTELKSLVSV